MCAAAVDQLGNFGTQRNVPNATSRAAVSRIKELTFKALASESVRNGASLEENPLPTEDQLSIIEVNCPDEGCPDLETKILILREGHREHEAHRIVRIRKPLLEIDESDVKAAFSESAISNTENASAVGPCSCCESNLQKQRDGCSCCGWRLPPNFNSSSV